MKRNLLPMISICCFLFSCNGFESSGGADKEAVSKNGSMLPAWKLPHEYRFPGKADYYDDYRAQNPEWYALTTAPNKSGFRALREYEEIQIMFLAYTGGLPSGIDISMVNMVKASIDYAYIYVIVESSSAANEFILMLKNVGVSQSKIDSKVSFLQYPLDSIWMVDFGPFPILDASGSIAFVDFRYYHPRIYDDAIPTKVGKSMGVTTFRAGMDWEGGNFFTDGDGTCYTTQGTLWENPDKSQSDINQILKDYLACDQVIYLKPLSGEGTSHIDMFFKMVSKNVMVLGKYTQSQDPTNYKVLNDDEAILKAVVLDNGSSLTVYRMPMPDNDDGVWRTYINSTYVKPVNMVPVYSINKDLQSEAMAIWAQVMPSFSHIPILSDEVITWGGAMHCISRTVPAGEILKWVADGDCVNSKCQAPSGGYTGECGSDSDCFGPKWLCNYNDCGGVVDNCNGITYEGCCDGSLLKWCENNSIKTQNCGGSPCGWNATEEYYDCGYSGSDPSGLFPKECPASCVPNCTGKECGPDGCDGSCGTCPTGYTCDANGKCVGCTPNCYGKECGSDGCGGSCGACQQGFSCNASGKCVCAPDCSGKECGSDGCNGSCGTCQANYTCNPSGQCVPQGDPCQGISYEGCCETDNTLKWCENNQLNTIECGSSGCGWDPNNQFYNCEYTAKGPPEHPKDCPGACIPDCSGKECGSDGCNGSCGACPQGKECDANGKCQTIVANECGDITEAGKCEGNLLKYCENNKLKTFDCTLYGDFICAFSQANKKYQCAKKTICTPVCLDKECGPDGCGSLCGECQNNEFCSNEGKCVPLVEDIIINEVANDAACTLDCDGKECGYDGCGGSCGGCPSGYDCNNEGQCILTSADFEKDAITQDIAVDSGNTGSSGGCSQTGRGEMLPLFILMLSFLAFAVRARRGRRRVYGRDAGFNSSCNSCLFHDIS